MPVISVKNLYKDFKDLRVLDGVSLDIKKGEKIVIIGASGSGKSTCARLAARLWDHDSGSLTVGGVEVLDVDLNRYTDLYMFNPFSPGVLQQFIETIEDSNGGAPGLVVQVTDEDGEPQEDIDETKLVGLKLGIVFGLEEKVSKKSGNIYRKEDFFNAEFVTVDDIHEGKFTVPELKKLDNVPTASSTADVVDTTAGFTPIKDEDVPF